MKRMLAALAVLGLTVTSVIASPFTFHFTFSSQTTSAKAVGFVTFESALLPNPGAFPGPTGWLQLPNPAVLDLQVTVSGATSGNGTFLLGSFNGIHWDTGDATLDLAKEFVGQPTPGSPWGTAGSQCGGNAGDFNFETTSGPGPNGISCFTLAADRGNADAMILTAMASPTAAPVPMISEGGLALLAAIVALTMVRTLRRRANGAGA